MSEGVAKKALVIASIAVAVVLVAWLVITIAPVLLLLFGAVLLAILLDGIAAPLAANSRFGARLSVAIVVVVLLGVLAAAVWFGGPRIVDQLGRLSERVDEAQQQVSAYLEQRSWGETILDELRGQRPVLPKGSDLLGRITGVFSTVIGSLINVLIVLVLGIYLAASKRLYVDNAIRLVPPPRRQRAEEVASALGSVLRWWLVGRFASMAVVGALTVIGLLIAGVPLPFTLGGLAALLSFVPFLGPVSAAVPAILVAWVDDPVKVVWVLVVYSGVQILENYVITPVIQERAVSVPPALLIALQLIMAVLFGLAGVLLATPLGVAAIVLIQMLYVGDMLGDEPELLGAHG